MRQRLYAVIGKVSLDGVTEVTPIFKELDTESYYILERQKEERLIKAVDVIRYGCEKHLPISKADIASANEVLILWEPDKCLQSRNGILGNYWGGEMINLAASWREFKICIGICENKNFMLCKAESEQEMEKIYLRNK